VDDAKAQAAGAVEGAKADAQAQAAGAAAEATGAATQKVNEATQPVNDALPFWSPALLVTGVVAIAIGLRAHARLTRS